MAPQTTQRFSRDNFEYNVITGEVIYIDEFRNRKNITLNAVIVQDYTELKRIKNPKFNAIYIVLETKYIYAFNPQGWVQLYEHREVQQVISHLDDLTPAIMTDGNGYYIAPASTISNIYSDKGLSSYDIIDDNYLRKYNVHSKYVQIEVDDQRVVNIPMPYYNYDFTRDHMCIIIDNDIIEPSKYIIRGDQVIFYHKQLKLNKGQKILFIFYYTTIFNLNENVILHTHNFANHSITTDKLDPNIVVKANNVMESTTRVFFTPEERNKLRGLNATNYSHPDTHPASMITETDDRKWLSPEKIDYWDKKANREDVFTKNEATAKIYEILDTEDLSKFRAITAAIANDPNFATTILNKLAGKADQTTVDTLKADVDKKVYLNDYIRGTVYDLTQKYTSDDVDHYSISLADLEFGEYIDGMSVTIKINETNKNKCRLRINELDFKPILNPEQFELIEGELKKGSIYQLRYNGTTGNFILQGKGGVKISDASLNKYRVGQNGKVQRGNPVDIYPDGTISKSRFKIDPIVKLITNHEHINASNLYVDLRNDKHIFVSWYANGKVYANTYNISNNYIEKNVSNTVSILNDDCSGYDIVKLSEGVYGTAFKKNDKLTIKIIPLKTDGTIDAENIKGSVSDATGAINKLYFIKAEPGRFVVVYNHSNVTETTMFRYDPLLKELTKISTRNNVDYPIDSYQRINDKQILFVGNYLNTIMGWVLSSDDTDFFNSTTQRLGILNSPSAVFEDVKLFPLINNRALMEYKIDGARCKKIVTVDDNALRVTEDSAYSENELEKKHNDLAKRYYVPFIDSFISASNYDYELDTVTGSGNTIKIVLEREGNNGIMYNVNKNNQFLLGDAINNNVYDMKIYNNKCILAYFSTDTKLKLVLIDIIRKPNGIAIGNGNTGEMVDFYKF